MNFLNKKIDNCMSKFILNGLSGLFMFYISTVLYGQKSSLQIQPSQQETVELRSDTILNSTFPANELFQKRGFIVGRLVKLNTNTPICFADISSKDKPLLMKSNSKGEFLLSPGVFPTTLKIRKFGYQDETIILDSLKDSVLISLTPLEVHKSYSGNNKLLQYELIFKKALQKFRADYNPNSQDH
jgi:hypothetical protein